MLRSIVSVCFALLLALVCAVPAGIAPPADAAQPDREPLWPVDHQALWPAQPALVDAAAAALTGQGPGGGQGPAGGTHVLAIAAGGRQQLFGREAAAALSMLRERFGPEAPGALLSNAHVHLGQVPLATRGNLAAVLARAARGFDTRRDLVIIYLAAHGSPAAELGTDLPDGQRLDPISAPQLARALAAAGIRRRVIIVSACFSGSWIGPLASPDTIILTAAAADRPSFGCDDTREFTVFGEAVITGSLRHGASLHQAFDDLKRRVRDEENRFVVDPSLPQSWVGARMQDVWSARGQAR